MSAFEVQNEKEEGKAKEGILALQSVRGFLISTFFTKENIEEAMDHMPQDGDVIIATYPKTGTTMMQYIVHQILTKGESFPNLNDMMDKVCPYLELYGISSLEQLTKRPRVYKHHMPYNLMKKNPNAKVIYVYRRPEDTYVSYYHFNKGMDPELNFDLYFEDFLTGNISYGSYFNHVLSYLEHKDDDNLLMISYEEFQTHRKEGILKVAKFLGEEYCDTLVKDPSVLDKIMKHTSFEYMKANLSFKLQNEQTFEKEKPQKPNNNQQSLNFFRKGIVGDGKKSLSESQFVRLKKVAHEAMKGTRVLAEWYQE